MLLQLFQQWFKFNSKACNDCNSRLTAFGLENFAIIIVGYKFFLFYMTEEDVHNVLGEGESGEL